MAGTIAQGELTDPIVRTGTRFVLATEADDPAIRRLLRTNPLAGRISLTFEREPGYFHGTRIAGADEQAILAYEGGQLVCMGRISVGDRFLNGDPCRVGYLSDLRLDASSQGRYGLLRRGYQFFHQLQQTHPADAYFTSITTDNIRSLRFLGRDLPGMPRYEPIADFETLLIPVPRSPWKSSRAQKVVSVQLAAAGLKIVSGSVEYLPAIVKFLNAHARRFHLATVWTEDKLRFLARHDLPLENFRLLLKDKQIVGCAALWDQRRFKQIVIRGYDPKLAAIRPWLNFVSRLAGSQLLPPLGATLAHAFLSPLAIEPDCEAALPLLIGAALSSVSNLDFLVVGFAVNDPRLALVRRHFRGRAYQSRIFQVRWNNAPRLVLGEQPIFPEVSLL
jgi:hypothetical protein